MEGDLEAFVERTELEGEPSARTTDLRVTIPLLRILGWNVHAGDVVGDYAVETDEEPVTVDYALLLGGTPEAFVTTAAWGRSLTGAERRLDEAMAAAGVEWGVATNGQTYAFVAEETDGPRRVECELSELLDRRSVLRHYTRRAARKRRRRRRDRRRQNAAEALERRRESVVDGVENALVDGDLPDPIAEELSTAGQAFVEGVHEALSAGEHPTEGLAADRPGPGSVDESTATKADASSGTGTSDESHDAGSEAGSAGDEPSANRSESEESETSGSGSSDDSASETPESPTDTDPGEQSASVSDGGGSDSSTQQESPRSDAGDSTTDATESDAEDAESDEEYVIRFFDSSSSSSVGAVGHGTAAGALVQAIEYLVESHDIDRGMSLPWGPTEDRAVINDEPVHPDGQEMVDAAELSNGNYVCTTIGTDAVQNVIDDLSDGLGLRVMYQGDW